MAYRGWVLVQTEFGQARPALESLKVMDLKGSVLLSADTVTGPHDVILYLEASSLDAFAQTVQAIAVQAPGVQRTITCQRLSPD